MDLFANLALGFSTALSIQNLIYAFIGCVLGTLIGVLPGLGPIATIAMLLPATYALPPVAALIMLAGIYYGAQYGGSTTAILVNLPGESSSVVTTIDGYQMARTRGRGAGNSRPGLVLRGLRGHAGAGGICHAAVRIRVQLRAGGILFAHGAGADRRGRAGVGSLVKAIAMIVLGLLLGLVGTDVNSGTARYSFDVPELADGLNFVSVAMGVFGFAEIIANLEQKEHRETFVEHVRNLWPSREDFKRMIPAVLRGTALGSVLGILPGGGATLASFASYSLEKKTSKYSSEFGKGAIEGVAGPESANNAAAQTSFIPLLTLGIPPNAVMALMVGAMTIHNIQPGPQVMTSNPALFWGLIASMWIGNLMLIVLNLPMIGVWVRLLKVPYRFLYPAILVFCCIGVYSVSNTTFDIFQTALFGLIGYMFVKLRCEPAPMLLGFVLGPMMEENFRRALLLSRGDFSTFVTRPLSLGLLIAAGILVLLVALPAINRKREEAFQEE
ncbi:tripartite tricarboxylate transporter permease [Ralstonia sp. 1B3]|uniref:tripartite tricarboxylate transporter permease n=1 Tax=Ralstonia sp. 1B3 TaxID=2997421 RepID=UPI003FA6FFCB